MPYIAVNGVKLYHELRGGGDETVVFVNGVLANTMSWTHQAALLAKRYQVLLYDCRGQGQSEKPPQDYPMELHAADLDALLEALRIKRAHIVGISYGGEIGMLLAIRHPERVKGLIVADSVSQVDPPLERRIEAWISAARTRDPKRFFTITTPDIFSEGFIERNPQLLELVEQGYVELDYGAVARLLRCFKEFNITGELHKIGASTLIICGEKDRLKPPRYSELIHQEIPDSEFVLIKDAGHAVTYERPEEFTTVVLGFLEKLKLREG